VKSGRPIVRSPKDFADAAERLIPKIYSIYFPANEMMEEPSYVKDVPKNVDTLKYIKS